MVSIKSFFLNFFAGIFFTLGFLALFAFLIFSFLPEEINKLEKTLADSVPRIISNSTAIREGLSKELDNELLNDTDGQMIAVELAMVREQCTGNQENVTEPLRLLCPDFIAGKINTAEDFKSYALEKAFLPQILSGADTAIRNAFSGIREKLRLAEALWQALLIAAVVLLLLGGIFIFLDSLNIVRALHGISKHSLAQSLIYIIPLILPFALGLVGIHLDAVFVRMLKKAIPDEAVANEVLAPLAKLAIDWLNAFLMKLIFIFAGLALASLLLWFFTREKN